MLKDQISKSHVFAAITCSLHLKVYTWAHVYLSFSFQRQFCILYVKIYIIEHINMLFTCHFISKICHEIDILNWYFFICFFLKEPGYGLVADEGQSDLEMTGPVAKIAKFDSDEASDLRCDTCGAIFSNLTQFMDHRNFECSPGEFHNILNIYSL